MKSLWLAVCITVFVLSVVIPAVSQDKKANSPNSVAPTISDAQKVEILKLGKSISDIKASMAQLQANAESQYNQLTAQLQTVTTQLQPLLDQAKKACGDKYTLNQDTLECVAKPEPAKPGKN